jgi:hypothetical protein
MLSFTKIITLSAMALGTLTQAVPLLQRDIDVDADVVIRGDGTDTQTLEGVLDNLVDNLNKALDPIGMIFYSPAYSVSLISRQPMSQKRQRILLILGRSSKMRPTSSTMLPTQLKP